MPPPAPSAPVALSAPGESIFDLAAAASAAADDEGNDANGNANGNGNGTDANGNGNANANGGPDVNGPAVGGSLGSHSMLSLPRRSPFIVSVP